MKKLIIILGALGVSAASIIVPTTFVIGRFTNSLNNNRTNDETNTDGQLERDISDNNQGFLNISTLNLQTSLGEVESPTTEFIVKRLRELNSNLEGLEIFVKGISLTQARFTVQNHIGTMDAFYEITDLGKLVPNKNLGRIVNIRETTIINRIREINRNLASTDFAGEVTIKVISLNEISMDWRDAPEDSKTAIILTYEVTSLDGVFLNNDLGETNDLSIDWISRRLFELNPQAEFLNNNLYSIRLIDLNSQTPEFAQVGLFYNNNEVRFDGGSHIVINYNTRDIVTMISNVDLGSIDKLNHETILQRINSLNPIYGNFRNNHQTLINFGLTNATITNPTLANQIVVNYRVSNVAGLFESTDIDSVSGFVHDESTQKSLLIERIKTSNTLLRSLNDADFQITSINLSSFNSNDSSIRNNSFVLRIANFGGEVRLNFTIKRINISTLLTTTNLGTFFWVQKSDIIQRIKERNGIGFNDEEITYSQPTYTSILLTAREDSLSYYGNVTVTYTTNFRRTSDFTFRELQNVPTSTAEQTIGRQFLPVNDRGGTLTSASFVLIYQIPNGIDAALAAGKTKFQVNLNTIPSRITTDSSMNNSFLRNFETNNTLSINLEQIKNSPSNGTTFVSHSGMGIQFRARTWFGSCGNNATYNLSTNFSYSYWLSNEEGLSVINFRVVINSNLDDYSTCDNLTVEYTTTVKSTELI